MFVSLVYIMKDAKVIDVYITHQQRSAKPNFAWFPSNIVTPLASPRDVLELCIEVECLFEGGLVLLFIAMAELVLLIIWNDFINILIPKLSKLLDESLQAYIDWVFE